MRKLNSVLVRNDWTALTQSPTVTHDVCYAPRASDHMTRTGTTNPSLTYLSCSGFNTLMCGKVLKTARIASLASAIAGVANLLATNFRVLAS